MDLQMENLTFVPSEQCLFWKPAHKTFLDVFTFLLDQTEMELLSYLLPRFWWLSDIKKIYISPHN